MSETIDQGDATPEPRINFGDPAFTAHPYPALHHLRRTDPVHWSEEVQNWLIMRYDDIYSVYKDTRFSPSREHHLRNVIVGDSPEKFRAMISEIAAWMISQESASHARLRRLMTPGFSATVTRGLEAPTQAITDELLDRVAGQGRMDAVADLAYPLPVYVISEMLRIPRSDYDKVVRWSDDIRNMLGNVPVQAEMARKCQDSLAEMRDYFRVIVENLRREPGDDFMSYMVNARDEGDPISDEELYPQLSMLLFGGNETTRHLISAAIWLLLSHPDQLCKLKDDPTLIKGAIEETLRYEPPIQLTVRTAKEDIELGGKVIKKGQSVLPYIASGNRDPERFENPDAFDITRQDNRHLTFVVGPHFCIGAAVARSQGIIAVKTLLDRFPNVRLDENNPPRWDPNLGFHGLASVSLVF